jgi:PAS domain S-box-containing protein
MNKDETVMTVQLWSREAMAECKVPGPPKVFPIETTGLWGEAVRQRRPVITNDYAAPNPWKRGTPEEHVRITRHMNLPVIVGGRIVLVAGVGNKGEDYNDADVNQLTLLMEGMWRLIERKRSLELLHRREQEFRAVVENSPDTISRFDAGARLLYFNPALQRLFGLSEKDIHGKPPLDFSPLSDAAEFIQMVRKFWEKGIGVHKDISVRDRQGEIRWIDLRLMPEFGPDGKVASVMGIGRDVTEERKMEKELFRAKRMEIIGQLAGGVAHEVRNPLNAILSISEALFREKEIEGNPEYLPYIQHMRTQVGRLSKLMRDLLDLGKPISSENIQPVLLNDVLTEAISLWGMTEASRTHPLAAAGHDKTMWLVNANSTRLQQALLNLIENAAQHSPAGSEIRLQIDEPDGQRVSIQITDLGKGIPPEKLEAIFEPFFTTRAGGTGLGLALVKHFVESMGGSVRIINNEPPPGCTAEVILQTVSEKGTVDNETENTSD